MHGESCIVVAALKFFKTCVAMKFVDDDDEYWKGLNLGLYLGQLCCVFSCRKCFFML